MDDSDRPRDDDSAAADGSTDEDEPESDAAGEGGESVESVDAASESVESVDAASESVESVDAASESVESVDAASESVESVDAASESVESVDAASESVESEVEAEVGPEVDPAAVDADSTASADADSAGSADAADPSTDGLPATDDGQSLGDGGTPATTADAPTADAATAVEDEPFEGIEGPETDEEMPLAAHIEEMMRRLAVVFLIGGLATLVVVTESTELINYFWSYHIPAPLENRPRLYGPLELPLTRLKVAGLAGVVVGLPAFVYETYRFMRPGLYETERRYYLAAVPTSLILGGVGIAFAHFLVLPAIFSYFTTYTSDAATIAFGLAETFNLIVIMLAFMAIVFQIPLFIMLAIMMNLVTRQWLEAKRLIFWGSFLGIAFLFSPDPTGMAPIIVTLTMIALFEGTLAILRWTGN
ncbi:twin-arginine translocase subunit TatC [Halorubrum ezzemoulense]|uniref:twin-arginine translocase subunit TatC n=1 Tax=Halorubrum ezzemoulense TaxID=337243 RepID=UPI00232D1550|nr:twin-arginine translocase subunit TatC [Halorubrum ezzemoulense]MDB9248990.1 twin-arginine translocase subunit TatC [Halorubrum ezzemoulense]MDB9260117.1 twin-arginine translocase subunit TatC [Halorubrum ezzemoulense]MDB9262750.1 twin-arginine translocase subunit TatC [Halorubrum ezzemoulense]MDB9265691.1 twin-arginine translocase subunit TatC [Halorubrum ezzemoulense]MDB9270478.1 twin-arginine translocase subunit TatC [Halorubrum ezzemoulense]